MIARTVQGSLEAARGFRELREDARVTSNVDDEALYSALEASSWLLAEEDQDAHAALEDATKHVALSEEVAAELAEVALQSRRADLALQFAQPYSDELNELLAAEAHLHLEDEQFDASLTVVRRLFETASESDNRRRAAFALLMAATIRAEVAWDDDAAAMVDPARAWIPATMKAQRLAEEGDYDGAERLLLPYSDRANPIRALIDVAARKAERDGKWIKALRLSGALLGKAHDDSDRLRHAALLGRSGDHSGALAEYVGIARSSDAARAVRRSAYRSVALIYEKRADFGELATIGREWYAFAPDDADGAWLAIYALTRLTKVDQAYSAWQTYRDGLEVVTEEQALLVAQIHDWYAPVADALDAISSLSNARERPERLEYALIVCALRRGDAQLEPALESRVRESFDTFPRRFPESRLLRAIKIDPEDPLTGLLEMLEEQRDDRNAVDDAERAIADGTGPVAVLAALVGMSVGEVLLRMNALPLGFAAPELFQQDLAEATIALEAGGAVWDATSVYVAGGLDELVTSVLRNALPASRLGQATLDDAGRALAQLSKDPVGSLHQGTEPGDVGIVEADPDLNKREKARAAGTLELARSFPAPTRPASSAGEDPRLEELVDNEHTSGQFATFVESVLLAKRHGLPLYTDDRYVRQVARQIGVRAFGTLALLETLVQRDLLTPDQAQEARHRLLSTGAWGLRPTATELAEAARGNRYLLTSGVAQVLLDRVAWRHDTMEILQATIGFLQAVFDEESHELLHWLARILDAWNKAIPEAPRGVHMRNIMALVLEPLADDPLVSEGCVQAISEAFTQLPTVLDYLRGENALWRATALYLDIGAQHSPEAKVAVFGRILTRVGEGDRERLLRWFVTP